jgi:hypothetical protein
MRHLDLLPALDRISTIECHGDKSSMVFMVGVAHAVLYRLSRFRRDRAHEFSGLLSHSGDHSLIPHQPPRDVRHHVRGRLWCPKASLAGRRGLRTEIVLFVVGVGLQQVELNVSPPPIVRQCPHGRAHLAVCFFLTCG